MRVMHVDTERTWRGGEQQVHYLATGLVKRGVEVTLVCQQGSALAQEARASGLEVRELRMRGETDVPAALRIRHWFKQGHYDLLHMHTSHAHSLGVIASIFGGIPRLVVSRRVDFLPQGNPFSRFKYRYHRLHFITVSRIISEILMDAGVPRERIDVVLSGIDPNRFRRAQYADLRKELGIAPERKVIGNIGHLTPHKGQIDLIRAMPKIVTAHPLAMAVIVGDGELREELKVEVQRLGMDRFVIFTGFRRDIPDLLHLFDLFAFPSRLEGLGTSLLDAMSVGLPIVATQSGGIPEIVTDKLNGLMVPPANPELLADALIHLLYHPNEARQYGEAGRHRVENEYTMDRMVEGNLAVYRQLLARPLLKA